MQLNISWPKILLFGVFWSYGYQAALASPSILIQISLSIYFLGLIWAISTIDVNDRRLVQTKIFLHKGDVLVIVSTFLFFIIFLLPKLVQPISGDGFYYSGKSKEHELSVIEFFAGANNIPVSSYIYLLSIVVLAAIYGLMKHVFSKQRNRVFEKFIAASALFFFLRFISLLLGITSSPHPPLQIFPLWLSSSIFGLSDFSFRLPQTVGLALLSVWIYFFLRSKIGRINAFFVSISVCSGALVMHVATLVEGSIWSFIAGTVALVLITSSAKVTYREFFALIALTSLATLMRTPAVLSSIFVVVLFCSLHFQLIHTNSRVFLIVLLPIAVYIPFTLRSIIIGTGARYSPGEAGVIPNDDQALFRILYAFSEGVIVNTSLAVMGVGFIFAVLGVFLRDERQTYYWTKRALVLGFFIAGFCLFFSIRPILWGIERYKAEYLSPFVIAGSIQIYLFLFKRNFKKLASLLCGALFLYNLIKFYDYNPAKNSLTEYPIFKYQSEKLYDYKSALKTSKNQGLGSHTLYITDNYGVFPQVLSGYDFSEIHAAREILDLPIYIENTKEIAPELVNKRNEIRLVLVADHNQCMVEKFKELGWVDWLTFPNAQGTNFIYGLHRN